MIEITEAKLQDVINKSKERLAKAQQRDTKNANRNMAFLPEGNHKIRFFQSPDGELFRELYVHRHNKRRTICPNWLSEQEGIEGKYPECVPCKIAKEVGDWRLNGQYQVMVYGHLYETDNESEWWKPDTTYAIVGNSKLRTGIENLLNMLYGLARDHLLQMFNPSVSGPYSEVLVIKGSKGIPGKVELKPSEGAPVDAVDISKIDWVPLNEIWVPHEFNEDNYKAVTASMEEEYSIKPENKADTTTVENNTVASNATEETTGFPSELAAKIKHHEVEDCFTKYEAADTKCILCSVNMECIGNQVKNK